MLVKVNKVNVGNNVVRLDINCVKDKIPTNVLESILMDVIKQDSCVKERECRNATRMPKFDNVTSTFNCRREPDGIDIHVDRPLRNNFTSHGRWAEAMAKYRTLEKVARDCDWPCKEPMATVPNYRRVENDFMDVVDDMVFDNVWFI